MAELSAERIVELSKRYTLYDWQAQSKATPMAVASAEGVHFTTVDGSRFLDFNSQLMGVNIGHGDKRVLDAIARPGRDASLHLAVHGLQTRALLGEKLATAHPARALERRVERLERHVRRPDEVDLVVRPGRGAGKRSGMFRSRRGTTYVASRRLLKPVRPEAAPERWVVDPVHRHQQLVERQLPRRRRTSPGRRPG